MGLLSKILPAMHDVGPEIVIPLGDEHDRTLLVDTVSAWQDELQAAMEARVPSGELAEFAAQIKVAKAAIVADIQASPPRIGPDAALCQTR